MKRPYYIQNWTFKTHSKPSLEIKSKIRVQGRKGCCSIQQLRKLQVVSKQSNKSKLGT